MFRHHLDHLQVLNSYTFITHLAGHTHTFEYLCRVRTGTDTTGSTQTVMLTMSSLTYTTETMTLYYTLKTFTF